MRKSFRIHQIAKCLKWINDEFQALNESDQKQLKEFLTKTGCGELIAEK